WLLSGREGAGLASVRAGWRGIGPGEAPEIFGIEEFESDAEGTGFARFAPGHASAHAAAGVQPFDEQPIFRPDEVLALDHGAEAADQKSTRLFLPGTAGSFAEQAHGTGIGEARAAPQARSQIQGGVPDVQQAGALEGILRKRRARKAIGLIDARGQERPHLVRELVRHRALAEMIGTVVQALVAHGHEVFLAIKLTLQSRDGRIHAAGTLAAGSLVPF